ncbi:hypothetical protein [Ensifer sp. 4252]|uniref:hypothetical protein n=1 Tax=Ensifer sp. 4252 TaxID=3373915 RepID=UPI003D1F5980
MVSGSTGIRIAPPTRQPDDPDYGVECQAALDDHIRALCDNAGIVGWDQTTVHRAIAQIIERLIREYGEDPDPSESAVEVSIDLSDLS